MNKFTIVTYIKNGKVESKGFTREDSSEGVKLYEKIRDEGYEVYLFHRPIPTKHCKSKEAREGTNRATHGISDTEKSIVEKIASKVSKKSSKQSSDSQGGGFASGDASDLG
jgi:calcineurin-like phosphoesterase family protein